MSDFSQIWINGELLGELVEDVPAEIIVDRYGVSSAQLTYQCEFDRAIELLTGLNAHPAYPWLFAKTARVTREEALLGRIVVDYEGVDESTNYDEEVRKVYSVEGATSSEPNESHPRFVFIAGRWDDQSSWKKGAMFQTTGDDKGKFLGFQPLLSDGESNPKAGQKSYLMGNVIFTETRTYSYRSLSSIRISAEKLGRIDTPPNVVMCPDLPDGFNWLLITFTAEQVGRGMKLTRKWRSSGPHGWDEDWYSTFSPS